MMFFERSRDSERLARVKREAIKMGDAFLLHAVVKLQPDLVDEEEWRQAGEQAHKDGRFHFAREAFTRAGDAERAEEIRKELGDVRVTGSDQRAITLVEPQERGSGK